MYAECEVVEYRQRQLPGKLIKSSVYFPNFLIPEILLIKYVLKFDVRRGKLLGMVAHACDPSTGRVEAKNTFYNICPL